MYLKFIVYSLRESAHIYGVECKHPEFSNEQCYSRFNINEWDLYEYYNTVTLGYKQNLN